MIFVGQTSGLPVPGASRSADEVLQSKIKLATNLRSIGILACADPSGERQRDANFAL